MGQYSFGMCLIFYSRKITQETGKFFWPISHRKHFKLCARFDSMIGFANNLEHYHYRNGDDDDGGGGRRIRGELNCVRVENVAIAAYFFAANCLFARLWTSNMLLLLLLIMMRMRNCPYSIAMHIYVKVSPKGWNKFFMPYIFQLVIWAQLT